MVSYIKDDEHVFIAGMTGSGKTFMAQYYVATSDQTVFILDTKGMFNWQHVPEKERVTVSSLKELEKVPDEINRIIYRPRRQELTFDYYNAFFEYCYNLENCLVVIDEVMQVCPSPQKIPEFYKGILTRGREKSVTAWSLTQRPALIPILIYSESTHWFVFRLNAEYDRKKLTDFSSYPQFLTPVPKYYFWYLNTVSGYDPEQGILRPKKAVDKD